MLVDRETAWSCKLRPESRRTANSITRVQRFLFFEIEYGGGMANARTLVVPILVEVVFLSRLLSSRNYGKVFPVRE